MHIMENNHKKFKPYDRVLVRDGRGIWQVDFYSHWSEEWKQHVTLAFGDGLKIDDKDIIPFEGNEQLVGKLAEPEEGIELERGEWLMVSDSAEEISSFAAIRRFFAHASNYFFVEAIEAPEIKIHYSFAIRFSDVNPNDMEETRKHILCVRNGKVMRFKPGQDADTTD